jgi:hypothetical protein
LHQKKYKPTPLIQFYSIPQDTVNLILHKPKDTFNSISHKPTSYR